MIREGAYAVAFGAFFLGRIARAFVPVNTAASTRPEVRQTASASAPVPQAVESGAKDIAASEGTQPLLPHVVAAPSAPSRAIATLRALLDVGSAIIASVRRRISRLLGVSTRTNIDHALQRQREAMKARGGGVFEYALVTAAYWAFTLTDGAIRMLVLFQFHLMGYSAFQVASLFLLYEAFGVLTNFVGGWLASRGGVHLTLFGGTALQIVALLMLVAMNPGWSMGALVAYTMVSQALSGIAKDLTKMSAKSAIKSVVPRNADHTLYRWVSLLTGSKNALKGAGFFVGALLLTTIGFRGAALLMAVGLLAILLILPRYLPKDLGKAPRSVKFSSMFSLDRRINILSAARFFLFGARDVWFVVALPVYMATVFGWSPMLVAAYLALWTIGYGVVQTMAPKLKLAGPQKGEAPKGATVFYWASALAVVPAAIAIGLALRFPPALILPVGLAIFGAVFAINSAVHSYMIVRYADSEKVAMTVGFYYMSNAGGRLLGTVLSGLLYQKFGIVGCLWASALFVALAALLSASLSSEDPLAVGRAEDDGAMPSLLPPRLLLA